MKITPFNPNIVNTYASQARKDKAVKTNGNKPAGDQIEISNQARELNKYCAVLKSLPEVREEKVQDLKQRIKNGSYQPSPEKIADGMIKERHLDELV